MEGKDYLLVKINFISSPKITLLLLMYWNRYCDKNTCEIDKNTNRVVEQTKSNRVARSAALKNAIIKDYGIFLSSLSPSP